MTLPKDRPTRVFLAHAAIYAAVVLVLAGLNLWRAPDRLWVIWVALGWGAGLAFHAWCALFKPRRPQPAAKARCKER